MYVLTLLLNAYRKKHSAYKSSTTVYIIYRKAEFKFSFYKIISQNYKQLYLSSTASNRLSIRLCPEFGRCNELRSPLLVHGGHNSILWIIRLGRAH